LDPASRAIAGLALAAIGLMGQNLVQVGTQILLVGGSGSGGPERYFVATAIGALLPLACALWLAWGPARGAVAGWATHVARAAVVVTLVGVAGAVLTLLGGLLSGLTSGSGLIPM
ncbi:MAG TPA: hypothetical protein VFV40_02130, partial [Nocardioides sp.]|nr:hypothetical protein [Nocardioides sp.]